MPSSSLSYPAFSVLDSSVPLATAPRPFRPACHGRPTADELLARAEANGYKEGRHKEEDEVLDYHKHVEKTKRNQNRALNRYVL